MRLIDGDALMEEVIRACGIGDMIDYLEDAPTIEERKKGKWEDTIGGFYCSECGDAWSEERRGEMRVFNFCPNCGAYMRGDKE